MKLIANGRVWIDSPEGAFLGYGRIELLEKVEELGSIRQAALEMKISYKQAWDFIDQMNTRANTALVISKRGGKGGGSAEVTEEGKRLISLFQQFNKEFQAFLAEQTAKFAT
ncbi:winged helix-turn-helix domain-containing protein [Desertivirga arenae]|uniref:winged helix-turn-helix domain-containing protein n=1 Tax=Desertivirga arenae TaxID=2810309 RepID=UPI001A97197D|nr:LysR family transcriptional regulator [Pedobacter sp. SYSU D00823]